MYSEDFTEDSNLLPIIWFKWRDAVTQSEINVDQYFLKKVANVNTLYHHSLRSNSDSFKQTFLIGACNS